MSFDAWENYDFETWEDELQTWLRTPGRMAITNYLGD